MGHIYQLKVELVGSDPPVWRTLTVPGNTPFDHLHDIIQIAMGWQEESTYEFAVGDTRVSDFGYEIDNGENPDQRDTMDTFLDELVTMVKATFAYKLDDRREHKITLQEILHSDEDDACPVCIEGEGVCPSVDEDLFHSGKIVQLNQQLEHSKSGKSDFIAEGNPRFDKDEVNASLRRYHGEWEEIYAEAGEVADGMVPGDVDTWQKRSRDFEYVKNLKSHQDLLNDDFANQKIEDWIDLAIINENSFERATFDRLLKHGYPSDESRAMIHEVFAIEMFFELKYGTYILEDRYESNLRRLPEKPVVIPALQTAVDVLDTSIKGIPFPAIEYLHNDNSAEARTAVLKALRNVSKNEYIAEESTSLWYACAAEGHICEELIDPIIGFYWPENIHRSDWLLSQGQYLIGKLAQEYPDQTVSKVLDVMEKEARDPRNRAVYFLFDAFHFCNIAPYKERLLALIKQPDISYYTSLANTLAYLDIKEALPVLNERVSGLKADNPEKGTWAYSEIVEVEEAIEQLETGVNLYPDVDEPLCLSRGTTWREEFADAEEYFYEDDLAADSIDDSMGADYLDFPPAYDWSPQQPIIKENKTGRNDPCPCGSGKKYKKCCHDKDLDNETGL